MSDPIRAYLLIDDAQELDYRVVVCGGNHRISVLAHMGVKAVPFSFQPNYPREIRLSDALRWPAVKSNRMSLHDAVRIFRSFFRAPTEKLLPNW